MYFTCWKTESNCQPFLIVLAIIGICGGCIFIGIFFGIFFKPLNYTYTQAKENCKITNIGIADFNSVEQYAALTVEFQDIQGNQFRGYGCASSRKNDGMDTAPFVYSYYQRNEILSCNNKKGNDLGTQTISNDILNNSFYQDIQTSDNQTVDSQNDQNLIDENSGSRILTDNFIEENEENNITYKQLNQKYQRILKSRGSSRSRSKSRNRNRSNSSNNSSSSTSCNSYKQTFADIKLSAWHCIKYDQLLQDTKDKDKPLIYKQCFYTIYGENNKAKINAENSTSLAQEMKDFYMVTFENPPYYDKLAFQLIIAFCFIPFLSFTHFIWIPYAANKLEPNCCKKIQVQNKIEPQNLTQNTQQIVEQPVQRDQSISQFKEENSDILQNNNSVNYNKDQTNFGNEQKQIQNPQYEQPINPML